MVLSDKGMTLWSTMVVCSAMAMVLTVLMSTLWHSVYVLRTESDVAQTQWLCRTDGAAALRALKADGDVASLRTASPDGSLVRTVTIADQEVDVRVLATVGDVSHVLAFRYNRATGQVLSWEDDAPNN